MHTLIKPFFMICETPLHFGAGTDDGFVDNPIQREQHTYIPKGEGSSVKGAIRSGFEKISNIDHTSILRYFGYDEKSKHLQSGTFSTPDERQFAAPLGFDNARLLLMPIKSVKGVFAWVTCPLVLAELKRILALCERTGQAIALKSADVPDFENNKAHCVQGTSLNAASGGNEPTSIVLEQYRWDVALNEKLKTFAGKLATLLYGVDPNYAFWKTKMETDIVVLPNDDFMDFARRSTEVVTRNKIDDATGAVQDKALFKVEYLPRESVMYFPVFASGSRDGKNAGVQSDNDVLSFFENNLPCYVQMGGDETLGKGIMKMVACKTETKESEPQNQ